MLHLRGLSRGGFSDCLAAETRRDEDYIYYQPPEELEGYKPLSEERAHINPK
jgi:hypothetical protein